jgi:hypothetical protein
MSALYSYVDQIFLEDVMGIDPPYIVWDWEMVQEAIYPEDTDSVYAGVLWYGLECTAELEEKMPSGGDERRVIIPFGAKIEMMYHLRELLSSYQQERRRLEVLEAQARSGKRLERFEGHADWKDVLEVIRQLMLSEEAVNRLSLLFERYVRPAPFKASEITEEELEIYLLQISRKRPGARERNRADAYNLASVAKLMPSWPPGRHGRSACLISATKTVSEIGPWVKDPFYFVFQAQMRKEFPELEARKKTLTVILSSLLRYWIISKESPLPRQPAIRRPEARSFLHDLDLLHGRDPALDDLARIMSNAWQAVERTAQLARKLSDDIRVPERDYPYRLSGFKTIASRLSLVFQQLQVDEAPADAMHLEFEEVFRAQDVVRYRVRHGDCSNLFEVECAPDTMTMCWETELTYDELRERLKELFESVDGGGSNLLLGMRFPNEWGMKTRPLTSLGGFTDALVEMAENRKPSLIVVECAPFIIWFDPRDYYNPFAHPTRQEPLSALIACRTERQRHLELTAEFFEATSCNWMYWNAIKDILETIDGCYSKTAQSERN